MKRNIKRMLAFMLSIIMIVSVLPAPVFAENTPVIEVQDVRANPGGTADVQILLKNNPGIAAAILKVSYDSTVLTLNSFEYGASFQKEGETPPNLNSPLTLTWSSSSANVTGDVVFATLHFVVNEGAPVDTSTAVNVNYRNSDIININEQDVNFQIQNGSVEIVNGIPGDINGDREVNAKDLLRMRKYFSGWDVEVDMIALDVTGDGEVNSKDLLRFRKYFSGWDVEIYYGSIVHTKCTHTMIHMPAEVANCVERGNVEYWLCSNCLKYFLDSNGVSEIDSSAIYTPATGHTLVEMSKEPTPTEDGYKDGWKCSVCDLIIVEPTLVPALKPETSNITYKISGTDVFLRELEAAGKIVNHPENPNVYEHGKTTPIIPILDTEEYGYVFLGWYDSPEGGNRVTSISSESRGTVVLYAHWSSTQYQVSFIYDSTLEGLIDTTPMKNVKYKSSEAKELPILYLDGYSFIGWSDESGKIYRQIPVGSKGDKKFYANWLSTRNKAWANKTLGEPIVYTDDNTIAYCYEIGKVTDVPVYTIENYGYLNASGTQETVTKEVMVQTSKEMVEAYSSAVEKSTTENATWTFSDGWTDSMSISEEYAQQIGKTVEEIEAESKTESGSWYVNSSGGGSKTSTVADSTDTYALHTETKNTQTYGSDTTTNYESKTELEARNNKEHIDAEFEYKKNNIVDKVIGSSKTFDVQGGVEWDNKNETTTKSGKDTVKHTGEDSSSGSNDQTGSVSNHSASSTNTSTWNNESGYSNGQSTAVSKQVAEAISQQINSKSGYGSSYIKTGNQSNTQGLASTNKNQDEFSSKVSMSTMTYEKTTVTYSKGAAVTGYHRKVMAVTAHVFGVVGYDIANRSYYVYTYSVLDDDFHKYEDYSYCDSSFSDNQSGLIDFCIPSMVTDAVTAFTFCTNGLNIDQNGIVTSYTGTDSLVAIPDYVSVNNLDGTRRAIKVTGIAEGVFTGNTNITGVVVSDFITSIPNNEFSGCSELWEFSAPGVTSIGNHAFDGCTKLKSITIPSTCTYLGEKAFNSASFLEVEPANNVILESAINSGAKEIVISLKSYNDSLDGKTLVIPEGTECFTLRGFGKSYNDLTIISYAGTTRLNRININTSKDKPLQLHSSEITLAEVNVTAPGIILDSHAGAADIWLYGYSFLNSDGYSVLAKNVNLHRIEDEGILSTKLSVNGNLALSGSLTDEGSLLIIENGSVITVTEEELASYHNPYVIQFNANEGTCSTESITVTNGMAVGTLPEAERAFSSFIGWYTELEDGELVNENTAFLTAEDIVLYAHWNRREANIIFDSTEGECNTEQKNAFCGDTYGELPTAEREHYLFGGWYTQPEGGTKIEASSLIEDTETISLYAHWVAMEYSVTWNPSSDYSVAVTRTASPIFGAVNGTIANGGKVYYGDILSVIYSAGPGWTIQSSGQAEITVGSDIGPAMIHAELAAVPQPISWNQPDHGSIVVNRTASPRANAALGVVANGAEVYYDDVLEITYAADANYEVISHGYEHLVVAGGISSDLIYLNTAGINVNYTAYYYSEHGTYLGSDTVTRRYGTADTIYARAFTGYITPAAQYISWNSLEPQSIYFYYGISGVDTEQYFHDGVWREWESATYGISGVYYWANVIVGERRADSVDIRIHWLQGNHAYSSYGYEQKIWAEAGGVKNGSNWTIICNSSDWSSSSSKERQKDVYTNWFTVPVGPTETQLFVGVDTTDNNPNRGYVRVENWIRIPAY